MYFSCMKCMGIYWFPVTILQRVTESHHPRTDNTENRMGSHHCTADNFENQIPRKNGKRITYAFLTKKVNLAVFSRKS